MYPFYKFFVKKSFNIVNERSGYKKHWYISIITTKQSHPRTVNHHIGNNSTNN